MSDLHNFNAGRKSWKMYAKELTSRVGDDLTITPYEGEDLILEVSGNGNILFKEDGITYNLADLSNAASSNVNLTNYDDASFTNVDISGSLILNNIDVSGKLTQIDASLVDLANLSNNIENIESLTGTVDSTNYDYIHVTTSQHVKSSWSYGSDLSITTARAGMIIDGGLFIHASGTKSILDSINEQFATGGDVPLEADFMVGGTSHLIGNTYIGPTGNLILFGDIKGSTGQTILSSSGIVFESDLNVLNVGSDPKTYSSGISGEVLTSQGSSAPPRWVNTSAPAPATTDIISSSTSATYYPVFVDSTGSAKTLFADDTAPAFSFNPSSGDFNLARTIKVTQSQLSIGQEAGLSQGQQAVAIGYFAGQYSQNSNTVAIGSNAARLYQATRAVAIGASAGYSNQQSYAVAIGNLAGEISQGSSSVAIGREAAREQQNGEAVAIGYYAGNNNQKGGAIAIGHSAGQSSQQAGAVAIGNMTGSNTQRSYAVAIGIWAGHVDQYASAVAVGSWAGNTSQGDNSVAIGNNAGRTNQASNGVAVGNYAGNSAQASNGVAIGNKAGKTSQGSNAVAIGNLAGETSQTAGSIAINASGVALDPVVAGFHVKPVRGVAHGLGAGVMKYDSATGEITYSTT